MQEKTHDKNRSNVCILCYRKGKRSLSGKEIESIREFIVEDYVVENPCFPAGICEGCHLLLYFKSNGKDVKLPDVEEEEEEEVGMLKNCQEKAWNTTN